MVYICILKEILLFCAIECGTVNTADLMDRALAASAHAYCPYSHFMVGAALLTTREQVFTGCNVENISYSLTICAERVALYTAVCAGKKKGDFLALAIAGRMKDRPWQPCAPCGACRQVLAEFSSSHHPLVVVYVDGNGTVREQTISDLLPQGFSF